MSVPITATIGLTGAGVKINLPSGLLLEEFIQRVELASISPQGQLAASVNVNAIIAGLPASPIVTYFDENVFDLKAPEVLIFCSCFFF